MIRFELPLVELSKKRKFWLVAGIILLATAMLFNSENKMQLYFNGIIGVILILNFLPIKRGKQLRFVEIDDQQIRWNNYEVDFNENVSRPPVVLNWSEIKWIKLLQNDKLVFFGASSFDSQLWLHHYSADQQQKIIDTVKVYVERFSLRWVEEQKEAVIA